MDGKKDVLGMYVGENESAKYWLSILNGLKNRGVEDILITCVDGLIGFPEAISAVFPKTEIQQCIIKFAIVPSMFRTRILNHLWQIRRGFTVQLMKKLPFMNLNNSAKSGILNTLRFRFLGRHTGLNHLHISSILNRLER